MGLPGTAPDVVKRPPNVLNEPEFRSQAITSSGTILAIEASAYHQAKLVVKSNPVEGYRRFSPVDTQSSLPTQPCDLMREADENRRRWGASTIAPVFWWLSRSLLTTTARGRLVHFFSPVCLLGTSINPFRTSSIIREPFSRSPPVMEKAPSSVEEKASRVESASDVATESQLGFEKAVSKGTLAKMDVRLMPVLTIIYLLSFLDRTNVGNARVAGLQKDLHLTNTQYSIALTVTLVPYLLSEIPVNLLLKTVGPDRVIPTMLTLWGVVTTLQGLVHNYQGLLACRFFLGLFEGGIYPGIVLYLSSFYPRHRLQLRIATFFSAASLSGAFGGLLAFGIMKMDKVGGRPGWAWLFILEGLFSVLFGILSFFLLPRSVESATFLKHEEKQEILAQMRHEGTVNEQTDVFSWREVGQAFMLPQVLFVSTIFLFAGIILSSLAYFTPSILVALGYTASRAQLMSVPPFAAAFVVTMAASLFSDRYGYRGAAAMLSSVLCIIGFIMYLSSTNPHVQYGSLFFSISGISCSGPSLSTWLSNNAAPQVRRATAIALGFVMSNVGAILALWLFGSWSKPPRYTSGTIVLLVSACMMTFLSFCNLLYLRSQNRKKALARQERTKETEATGLGDRSAWFIYTL
ncbi:putative major facilitator superfamily protein [Lyophyllum shimeji]|uniref:Major facilitator superfamily protein n=1 Tax=Lyophyllum shimeji TaxID=47721 RepID=A0A9P3PSY5_LYOSH|nr:putative major facilitator superfamily protein [Lyophyllum shimeji]